MKTQEILDPQRWAETTFGPTPHNEPDVTFDAPAWSHWPDGHLFLGQRGPLAERGIREIIAKPGQATKNSLPLSAPTICATHLPNHFLILLPMDSIGLRWASSHSAVVRLC